MSQSHWQPSTLQRGQQSSSSSPPQAADFDCDWPTACHVTTQYIIYDEIQLMGGGGHGIYSLVVEEVFFQQHSCSVAVLEFWVIGIVFTAAVVAIVILPSCVCMCVCVWEREREGRGGEREREREREVRECTSAHVNKQGDIQI